MAMTVAEVQERAQKLMGKIKGAKLVSEQEAAMNELSKLADAHAFVHVIGVGGPGLKAKKKHLAEVERELERLSTRSTSPALGGKIRELLSTKGYLTRAILREEDAIFNAIEGR